MGQAAGDPVEAVGGWEVGGRVTRRSSVHKDPGLGPVLKYKDSGGGRRYKHFHRH